MSENVHSYAGDFASSIKPDIDPNIYYLAIKPSIRYTSGASRTPRTERALINIDAPNLINPYR